MLQLVITKRIETLRSKFTVMLKTKWEMIVKLDYCNGSEIVQDVFMPLLNIQQHTHTYTHTHTHTYAHTIGRSQGMITLFSHNATVPV